MPPMHGGDITIALKEAHLDLWQIMEQNLPLLLVKHFVCNILTETGKI